MNIKNQDCLIKELNTYFKDYKKFKMPSFRQSAKDSSFFKNNYSKIYKLFYLKNKNFEQIQNLNDLILISYFSSKNSIKSIKKLNNLNNDKKKIDIKNLFIRSKKKIYLKI
jgi:hypothetical protein